MGTTRLLTAVRTAVRAQKVILQGPVLVESIPTEVLIQLLMQRPSAECSPHSKSPLGEPKSSSTTERFQTLRLTRPPS